MLLFLPCVPVIVQKQHHTLLRIASDMLDHGSIPGDAYRCIESAGVLLRSVHNVSVISLDMADVGFQPAGGGSEGGWTRSHSPYRTAYLAPNNDLRRIGLNPREFGREMDKKGAMCEMAEERSR